MLRLINPPHDFNADSRIMSFAAWINAGLKKPGKRAKDLAEALSVRPDIVSKMRNGTRQPRADEISIIEAYLGQSAPMRNHAEISASAFPETTSFDIVHWIAHGVFFEHEPVTRTSKGPRYPQLNAPRSRKFPGARHFAYEMRDNSMDRAPIVLSAGAFALCLDIRETNQTLTDGKIYVLELNHGTTHQVTCRRAAVFRDHVEFSYASSSPELAAVPALRYSLPLPENVTVAGRVFASFMPDPDEDFPRA